VYVFPAYQPIPIANAVTLNKLGETDCFSFTLHQQDPFTVL
jgi:hypothetical protein